MEPDLARFLAVAPDLTIIPDVAVLLTAGVCDSATTVADVAFALAEELGIDRVREQLGRVPLGDGWSRRQHRGLDLDVRRLRRDAAAVALRSAAGDDLDARSIVDRFVADRGTSLRRAAATVAELEQVTATLDSVAVAVRAIRNAIER